MRKEILLVTGLSGAGKTSASSVLEDMGYHVIDQFPVQLTSKLVDLIESTNDVRYNNVVLTIAINDFNEFYRFFANEDTELDIRTLFLTASDEVLLNRYKFTRRVHPLLISNKAGSLEEAISFERDDFDRFKEKVTYVIDTTYFSGKNLKKKLEALFSIQERSNFTVSFVSFGYKHGVCLDADLMIDVRFLPNPFWDVELRPYSGNDKKVYDYVINSAETQEYLQQLLPFLDYSFLQYVKEGKNHFTVGVGCTGGQHRSVSITNFLYDHYKEQFTAYKFHRDIVKHHDETKKMSHK